MTAITREITVDGATLWCRTIGSGEPLVLVHGGWTDHGSWRNVEAALAESFQVVTYDRRGHSRSEVLPGADESRRAHEDDVAAVIDAFGLGSAHLGGNSYGAIIVLGVATRYPELVRSVIAHEPPLLGAIAADSPEADATAVGLALVHGVGHQIRGGDVVGGVARFVEEGILGPGGWQLLPADLRRTMVANAPTFLAMLDSPGWSHLDFTKLSPRAFPILLTDGGQSPPWLPAHVHDGAAKIDGVQRHTFTTAGHMPQVTHPEEYVALVHRFVGEAQRRLAS